MSCIQSGNLEELDVQNCKLKHNGMCALGIALSRSKLKKLHAADNLCGDNAAIQIAESLNQPSCNI